MKHDTNAESFHSGASAFRDLCRTIDEMDFGPDAGERRRQLSVVDDRNYAAVVRAIRASLDANLRGRSAEHSNGYLRAIADLVCANIDGCGINMLSEDWNPIGDTEPFVPSTC